MRTAGKSMATAETAKIGNNTKAPIKGNGTPVFANWPVAATAAANPVHAPAPAAIANRVEVDAGNALLKALMLRAITAANTIVPIKVEHDTLLFVYLHVCGRKFFATFKFPPQATVVLPARRYARGRVAPLFHLFRLRR